MVRAVASGDVFYVDPCRYVKEIWLWIERRELSVHARVCMGNGESGRTRDHEVVCASCRIHSPASAEMG